MESIEAEKSNRLKVFVLGTLMAVGLLWGATAWAGPSDSLKIKLSRIGPAGSTHLTGLGDRLTIKIPIPRRWQVEKAHLSLAYAFSSALEAERSRLVLSLNGIALDQAVLDPRSPEGVMEVDVPPDLLLPDYNDLSIVATMNTRVECRDPGAPELWTDIRLDDSFLALDFSLLAVPQTLASIADFIFDPKNLVPPGIHLVLPDFSPQTLHQAALVASGAALRYEYRPVDISVSDRLVRERDNIVIGPPAFLAQVTGLPEDRFTEGNLGVFASLGQDGQPDPTHALVAVIGKRPEEIDLAARALAVLSFPWPDKDLARVSEVKLPEITRFSGKAMTEPGHEYLFEDLGLSTTTLMGFRNQAPELGFRLPADFLAKANAKAQIQVHLAYGAGLRQDSTLNLFLNDRFIGAIPLDSPNGGRYDAFVVQAPTSMLKPGLNRIAFQNKLIPMANGPCTIFSLDGLMVTVFGDSRLKLPSLDQWVAMPEISLFFLDGFPHAAWPDWRTGAVFLAEKDPATIGAALNLVAMISQKMGIAPYRLEFSYDLPPDSNKNLLVVGTLNALPEKIRQASPLAQGLTFPFKRRVPVAEKIQGVLHSLIFLPDPEPPASPEPARVVTDLTLNKENLLLLEFESNQTPGQTILVAAARAPEDLLAGVLKLWDPAVQSQCRQDTILLDAGGKKERVFTQKSGSSYFLGRLSRFTWLDRVTHTHLMAFYAGLGALILLIAFILFRVLRRIKKKRLNLGGGAQ